MNYLNRQSHSLLLLLSFLLCSILSSCTTQEERQRYAAFIEHADSLNKADQPLPSDSLLRDAANWYDRHGTANERMRAHYLLGRCYHDLGEAPRALECYQHAAEQADTTREDCDLHQLHLIYGQMADLYYAQYLPDDEMQALQTCERIAWKERDTLPALKAYELRFRPYYQKNDTDSILYYVTHAYQLYRKYGYNQEAANIIGMRACIYLDRHQYAEAQKDLRIYKNESGLFDKQGNIIRGREIRYYDEGRYQLGIGHVDSALYWFRRTLSYGYAEAAYKGMLEVYKQKHIADSVAKYAELFAKANDDSYLENSMELMRMQTSLYNYQRNKQIAEQKEAEAARERRGRIRNATIIVILLLTGFSLFLFIRKRQKQRLQRMEKAYTELLDKLSVANRNYTALFEEYQELNQGMALTEHQKQEYHTLLETKKLEINYLEEKMAILEQDLRNLIDQEHAPATFFETDIYQLFHTRSVFHIGQKCPNKQEWKKFEATLRRYFPRYYQFIVKEGGLPENQCHLCILIKAGFNEQEMGVLMGKDSNQIYRLKKLANKKLFGTADASSLKPHLEGNI